MNGGTDGNDFIGIHTLVRLLAENVPHQLLHFGNAGAAADEHDFVDVAGGVFGILESLQHRLAAAFDEVVGQFFELGPADGDLQVLRNTIGNGDERQVDVRLRERGEFLLGLLAGFLQPLQGHRIFAKIDSLFLLEIARHEVNQHFVKVVATEVRVAVGADDFENLGFAAVRAAASDRQYRDVERAAAEVEHDDLFVFLLIQAVGEGCRGWFVDDAGDFQSGDLAGVFRRLPLRVVEVSGDGDDRLVDFVAEIGLRGFLQLAKDLARDFLGREFLARRL